MYPNLGEKSVNELIMIIETAKDVWGDECHFSKLDWLSDGMPAYDLPMILYGSIKVVLEYDCGGLEFRTYTPDGEKQIKEITQEELIAKFLDAMSPAELRYDFKVLDRAVCRVFGLSGTAEPDGGFAAALDE